MQWHGFCVASIQDRNVMCLGHDLVGLLEDGTHLVGGRQVERGPLHQAVGYINSSPYSKCSIINSLMQIRWREGGKGPCSMRARTHSTLLDMTAW